MRTWGLALAATVTWITLSVASAGADQNCDASYTVQSGDSLGQIAQRCGTTVDAILDANDDLSDPHRIRVGQELVIPVAVSPDEEDPDTEPEPTPDTRTEAPSTVPAEDPEVGSPPDEAGQHVLDGYFPAISALPEEVAPGSWAIVAGAGFPPDIEVTLRGGPSEGEAKLEEVVQVDGQGQFSARFTLPSNAADDEAWRFRAESEDGQYTATSETLTITP